MQYLIDQKCSIETASFGGLRPLHHACNKNLEKITRSLLSSGAEVNSADDNGDTALHYAASRGVLNIVVALLDAGATVGKPNGQNVTPLMKTCIFGQYACCKKLVEVGSDKDAVDQQGGITLYSNTSQYLMLSSLLVMSHHLSSPFTSPPLSSSLTISHHPTRHPSNQLTPLLTN